MGDPIYEANPKHKEPWQPGRKGSLCPAWSHELAQDLLRESAVSSAGSRFATRDGQPFAGQEHQPGYWHGYPISWSEVPEKIRRNWIEDGMVTRKQIRDSWESHRKSARD